MWETLRRFNTQNWVIVPPKCLLQKVTKTVSVLKEKVCAGEVATHWTDLRCDTSTAKPLCKLG